MRVRSALIVVVFAGVASMAARGSSLVIDNFSCSDTVTLDGPAGATAFNASFISCPGSIGGNRRETGSATCKCEAPLLQGAG